MNYTPLNIKTNNTLLSSLIRIDDLIDFAKENNIRALTITDNNMYGVMEFYQKCIQNDIKPIVGLEIEISKLKIILYAKNYEGYKSLIKIATLISENNINLTILKENNKSLICIIPYESITLLKELEDIYKDLFIGYKNIDEKNNLKTNNLVYMNEILYLTKEDSVYLNYLLAIKNKIIVTELGKFNNHLVLDNITESDLENNQKINNMCNLDIQFNVNLLPVFPCEIDSHTKLKQLCKEGLLRIFGSTVKKIYLERTKYELDVIHKMGFEDYFLIVWDYVRFAKENKILVAPGRGSAAGSLVSYLLNITTIDPIKYNLLFERFLNSERITMPDIDIDFDSEKRMEVINYCIQKYGVKKVAPIITFSTLKSKQAIKDVARSLNIENKQVDILCNMLDRNLTLIDNYNQNEKIRKYINQFSELKKIYTISLKVEGLKRQISTHAAGVVMASTDLEEVIPLEKSNDFYLTGYSMEYLEKLGLIKMDFLGIAFLTLISNVLKDIEKIYNKKINFDDIPLDNKEVYEIFKTANTLGIFQFESSGMMNFLRKLKPDNFEDLVAAIALFRPGPMANIDTYIKRKQGKEKVTYIIPQLESILENTYGIIIYQEQIMQIASTLASYTLGEADVLRNAMSKKKEKILLKEKDKFINGCIKNNISELKAKEIYDLIIKFASYGFNRSHSVAYSIVAYKMAYLKKYYKEVFLKNLLTRFINSFDKTKEYIYESKKNNINILKPDINLSTDSYEIEKEGIRYPLLNIKNVGSLAVNAILKERNIKPFKDIFDFAKRVYGKTVNKKTIEALIDAGTFDSFGYTRRVLNENLDVITNYSELGDIFAEDDSMKPVLSDVPEYDKKELLKRELEVFGFYLSEHPIISYKLKYNSIELIDIENYFDKTINTVIYVDKIKEVTTKNNEKMLFITGSDELAIIDIVVFPKIYQNITITPGIILKIKGKVEKRYDKYQLLAQELIIL